MNRKERRSLGKRLGITQFQQTLPREKKFDLIAKNIEAGKKMHEEFVEKSRIMQEQYANDADSQKLYNLASNIAYNEKIPLIDAFEKAKAQLFEESKSTI